MPLLINLKEESYFEIKNDRHRLVKKIKQLTQEVEKLNEMLKEYDLAIERLKDFYEPKVIIKKTKYFKGNYYQGIIRFNYPEPHEIKFKLGKESDFKGEKDKNLLMLADKMGREEIRKQFPTYFL
jgi:hypothetical protein